MEKKPLQAKNVVSFGDGTRISRPKKETPAPVVKKETTGFIKKEAAEAAENTVSEMAPPRKAPEPEGIETRPLNLRQSRYLDEEPQAPDWADEDDEFDDYEDDENTFDHRRSVHPAP